MRHLELAGILILLFHYKWPFFANGDSLQENDTRIHLFELDFNCSVVDINLMKGNEDSAGKAVTIVVPVLFGIIAIAGLIGNLLVILVVIKQWLNNMKSATNLLIINLAVSPCTFAKKIASSKRRDIPVFTI